MTAVMLIIILAAAALILLFTVSLKVMLVLDTYKPGFKVTLLWLHSLFKAFVTMEDSKPVLTMFLFNKKLFRKYLRIWGGKHGSIKFLKLINPEEVHINARYGFRDPFVTGITCGAVSSALQFINNASINQVPDFTSENDYIQLDADARINVGHTLMNLVKSKT